VGSAAPVRDDAVSDPGAGDPLGESILDHARPWWRVFEPAEVRLVVGRYQVVADEINVPAARSDNVPIHRRQTGGGAVVLAPGALVVGLRLHAPAPGAAAVFALVNGVLAPAIGDVIGHPPVARGHGDLALPMPDGDRKILGASLRCRGGIAYYLGVLLVDDLTPLMRRYLRLPGRMPSYRAGRDHAAFCTHLARWGAGIADLRQRIADYCEARLRAAAVAD
jgi:lipoate-protein ligase A